MEIEIDFKNNRMIIDFKDDSELDNLVDVMEEAGYKVKKIMGVE